MIWSLNNIIDHPWITDLKYAKKSYEKKSKTDFYYGSSNPNLSDRLDLLSHNIAIYTKDTAVVTSINGNDISETYGKIEFEILWEHFPEEQRNDPLFEITLEINLVLPKKMPVLLLPYKHLKNTLLTLR